MNALKDALLEKLSAEAWRTWVPPDPASLSLDQQGRLAAHYLLTAANPGKDSNSAQVFNNMLQHNPAGLWKRYYNTSADKLGTAGMWIKAAGSRPAGAHDFAPALKDYEGRFPGITNWVSGTYGAESSYGANKGAKGNFFQLQPIALKELKRRNMFDKAVDYPPKAMVKPTMAETTPAKPLDKGGEETDFNPAKAPHPEAPGPVGQGLKSTQAHNDYEDKELNELMFALGGPPMPLSDRKPFKPSLAHKMIGVYPDDGAGSTLPQGG